MKNKKRAIRKGFANHLLFRHGAIILVMLLAVGFIYWPGVHGPFVLDDGENITLNSAIAIKSLHPDDLIGAMLANNSGPLHRPLASLSFALNAYYAGDFSSSIYFKITNILIHGINGVLVYFLTLLLLATPRARKHIPATHAPALATLSTILWAVHPIQLTSVLYVVQRMTSMSSMFMLVGLLGFMHGRLRYETGENRGAWIAFTSIILGTAFGLAAKENAILLPVLAAVIEYTLFATLGQKIKKRRALLRFYAIILFAPLLAGIFYLAWNPEVITNGYMGRDFTVWQRLLTQSRVLSEYLLLIFFPHPRWMGLFHDDIAISSSLIDPPTTLLAVAAWIAILVWALARRTSSPIPAFAVLWFLANHALESSVIGLELAYEHRNYLASLGPIFAMSMIVVRLMERKNRQKWPRSIGLIAIPALLCFCTWSRAHSWSDASTLASKEAQNHPLSARAQDFAARVALQTNADIAGAINYTYAALKLQPHQVGSHIDLQILLSILADEVGDQIRQSRPSKKSTVHAIAIEGLPSDIKATYKSNHVHFELAGSSTADVASRLQNTALNVHAMFSLDNLRRCVLTPPYACHKLDATALHWHQVALQNTRITNEYRSSLYHNLALFHAHAERYNDALRCIENALESSPNRIGYRLGRAEYLIRSGRLAEAKTLLNEVAHNSPAYELRINSNPLERLNAMVARLDQKK